MDKQAFRGAWPPLARATPGSRYSTRAEATFRHRADVWCLAAFLLAQGYTIPVLAIGPGWALWPSLPDLIGLSALVVFAGSAIWHGAIVRPTLAQRRLTIAASALVLASIASYMILTVADLSGVGGQVGVPWGAYHVCRLLQALAAFWVTTRIRLTASDQVLLGRCATAALLWVCVTVVLTGIGAVPPGAFALGLPEALEVAGPWSFYLHAAAGGLGTIGYNHAYVAAQLLLLLALHLHFAGPKHPVLSGVLVLGTTFAALLTGSRAGFAAVLLFVGAAWLRRPLVAMSLVTAGWLALMSLSPFLGSMDRWVLDHAVARQLTLTEQYSSDNLSGRDGIWRERIEFLNEEPVRWLIGTGVGSARESGENAHMLYLQIVVESGVIGLTAFMIFFCGVLRALSSAGRKWSPLFWGTIALLVSALTQETLYPVPAFATFLLFYSVAVAVAIADQPRVATSASVGA